MVGDFLAGFFANVAADALSEEERNDLDQREQQSDFDVFDVNETFVIEPEGWTVNLMEDGTFWFDMDRDGTPDTHATGTPDGGLYYDSNGDGNFDTNINHLVNPGP